MTEKIEYLEQVDVFQHLTQADLEAIDHQTHMVEYRADHIFYMPDDDSEAMFILKRGRVQLYRMSEDGRKLIVSILHPGAIFGHMEMIGQQLHQTYAQALDDCLICIWHREEVARMLMQRPDTAMQFMAAIGQRLLQVEERLAQATFKLIPQRLASLLLQLEDHHGEDGVIKGYTHQYLADMLGTYRETTTQILNEFKQREVLELGRKQIRIMDRSLLTAIADGES